MPLAQNPLSVEVELPREDVALITVDGYLDVDTATEFQAHLANQLHHGRRHFLLDLSSVPFMDSSISENLDEALARVDAGPDLPEEPSV